jgi:hypothetical protein
LSEHEPSNEPTSSFERNVRGMLADRAGAVRNPADLAGTVIARHRRGRLRAAAVTAVAVAVIGTGVPVGLHTLRAATPVTPPTTSARPGPSCSPALPTPTGTPRSKAYSATAGRLPAQTHARGSLGGDAALVRRVLAVGWAGLLADAAELNRLSQHPAPTLDPSTAKVQFVQQVNDEVVALVVATDAARRWAADAWVTGPASKPTAGGGESGVVQAASFDRPLGQAFYGDNPLFLNEHTTRCGEVGVVLAPADSQARFSTRTEVAAAGNVAPSYLSVPLVDGVAVFPIDDHTSTGLDLQVLHAGRVIAARRLPLPTSADQVWPPADQLAEAIRAGRGDIDTELAKDAIGSVQYPLRSVTLGRPEVIWGGKLPGGRSIVLAGTVFSSGARYLNEWHRLAGGGTGSNFSGLLPAGALDHQVLAWTGSAADTLVVFATRAVRAEAVLTGGAVVPIPLVGGGAAVRTSGHVELVRMYDASNTLIEKRKPGTGVLDMPGAM